MKMPITARDRTLYAQELVRTPCPTPPRPHTHLTPRQICALCALRTLEVAHLDIKPSNVLIASSGRAVLSDIGRARGVPLAEYETWAAGTSPVGTYPYMAPEMARRGDFGTAADVWSLGLVLAEVLGVFDGPRFHGRSVEELAVEHMEGPVIDLKNRALAEMDMEFVDLLLNVSSFSYLDGGGPRAEPGACRC